MWYYHVRRNIFSIMVSLVPMGVLSVSMELSFGNRRFSTEFSFAFSFYFLLSLRLRAYLHRKWNGKCYQQKKKGKRSVGEAAPLTFLFLLNKPNFRRKSQFKLNILPYIWCLVFDDSWSGWALLFDAVLLKCITSMNFFKVCIVWYIGGIYYGHWINYEILCFTLYGFFFTQEGMCRKRTYFLLQIIAHTLHNSFF